MLNKGKKLNFYHNCKNVIKFEKYLDTLSKEYREMYWIEVLDTHDINDVSYVGKA